MQGARGLWHAILARIEVVAWIVTAAIFGLDLLLPPGFAVGVLYVGVILVALWVPRPRFLLQYAAVVTALEVFGVFWPFGGPSLPFGLFNRAMSIFALWVTTGGICLYKKTAAARRRAEMQLREQAALAELGQMSAAVAHEVRNALTGIGLSVDLAFTELPPQCRDEEIYAETTRRLKALSDTVTDLVTYAETRRPVLVPVPLGDLVEEAVVLARGRLECASLAVEVDVPSVVVYVDREQVKRVIFNLILNGAQAMDGTGELAVRASVTDDRCRIQISDRGPGLAASVRERLFEPFFSTKNHGLGVGLAFAQRIARSHGGGIHLIHAAAGGTTASLDLPLAPGAESAIAP
jgi:signal transduction histidine kinase